MLLTLALLSVYTKGYIIALDMYVFILSSSVNKVSIYNSKLLGMLTNHKFIVFICFPKNTAIFLYKGTTHELHTETKAID